MSIWSCEYDSSHHTITWSWPYSYQFISKVNVDPWEEIGACLATQDAPPVRLTDPQPDQSHPPHADKDLRGTHVLRSDYSKDLPGSS
jgi:hypothetical protein